MASRYININVNRRFDKKLVYESVIYPSIPIDENDIYVTSRRGDRLDLLAHKYYEDKSNWWIIAIANNIANGSMHVIPGEQLRIPTNINSIVEEYKKINNNG